MSKFKRTAKIIEWEDSLEDDGVDILTVFPSGTLDFSTFESIKWIEHENCYLLTGYNAGGHDGHNNHKIHPSKAVWDKNCFIFTSALPSEDGVVSMMMCSHRIP